MTAEKSVFSGDYTDIRFVKSRKVAQIVMEIPIEQATAFVAAFGAPDPSTGIPVAIARLGPLGKEMAKQPPSAYDKPKRSWDQIQRSQQAALMCGDPEFDGFLDKTWPSLKAMKSTADKVRHLCIVVSRADLDKDSVAADRWDKLFSDFQLWKRGAAA